jgi:BMFP domain-containing protein YqiC
MFGTKPEGFKYKNEVKALIREATMELNQRILELETQNRQLTHELYQIKNGVVNDFQVVDRHMTELANMWHPMMMQNINRIQADLETTIRTEREGVKKVQEELEQKMASMINDNKTNIAKNAILRISDHVGCCIKLSDIKKHFDDELVRWEEENKTKYNPEIHGKGRFDFRVDGLYTLGINIVDDNNNVIINGSNKKMNRPADMGFPDNFHHPANVFLDNGWKMFLDAMPYVMLMAGAYSSFKQGDFIQGESVDYQTFNEYVLSPHHATQYARRNRFQMCGLSGY